MALDRGRDAPPLYLQIARELAHLVETGAYGTGEIIPSEKQLQEKYGVSRMTVRLAVAELANKGYLECMRGIGTVVTYGKIEENLSRVISFTEEMQLHGVAMTTALCETRRVNAPPQAAQQLRVREGAEVFELTRLRCANEKPLVYSVTYLARADLPLDPGKYRESLYEFLNATFGVRVARGEDVLEATLAEGAVAKALGVPQGFPTFKRSRTTFDQLDAPVEYSVCYYPGDKYKYLVRL